MKLLWLRNKDSSSQLLCLSAAAKDFAAALKQSNCELESLFLSHNNFTDKAAQDFAAALADSNCKLRSLALFRNKFTDDAAEDFAASLKDNNCTLELLDLSHNNFTQGRKHLIDAEKESNCKVLVWKD